MIDDVRYEAKTSGIAQTKVSCPFFVERRRAWILCPGAVFG